MRFPIGTVLSRLPTLLISYRKLKPWVGGWEMFDFADGQIGKKEEGAFLTKISPKPWWKFDFSTLDVEAQDWDRRSRRVLKHYGFIKLDPNIPTQGTRTVIYRDSLVTMHAHIEFGSNPDVLIVTPIEAGYNKHVLRRTHRWLDY